MSMCFRTFVALSHKYKCSVVRETLDLQEQLDPSENPESEALDQR